MPTGKSGLTSLQLYSIGKGLDSNNPISTLTGKLNYNEGFDRINQSLKIIFETTLGEVPMLPLLGSNLYELLFDPADEVLEDMLDLYIKEAVQKLEPRISVTSLLIDVTVNPIKVVVEYVLTNTNIAGKFDYNITRPGGESV